MCVYTACLVNYSVPCTDDLIIKIKFGDSFEKIDFENVPDILQFREALVYFSSLHYFLT